MEPEERFVDVDFRSLSTEALRGLLEEFVTREGTDYGLHESDFDEKVRDVERQLESGEARIVFDLAEERANIVPAEEGPRRR
jgi:uncharacterized protein YheU (UPF0270 family)